MLDNDFPDRYEVHNFGVSGADTIHVKNIVEKEVLQYEPDIITVMSFWNYFLADTAEHEIDSIENPFVRFMDKRSTAFFSSHILAYETIYKKLRLKKKVWRDTLEEIIRLGDSVGATVILVKHFYPLTEKVSTTQKLSRFVRGPNEVSLYLELSDIVDELSNRYQHVRTVEFPIELMKEIGAVVLAEGRDPFTLQKDGLMFGGHIHPYAQGNEFIADRIFGVIEDLQE